MDEVMDRAGLETVIEVLDGTVHVLSTDGTIRKTLGDGAVANSRGKETTLAALLEGVDEDELAAAIDDVLASGEARTLELDGRGATGRELKLAPLEVSGQDTLLLAAVGGGELGTASEADSRQQTRLEQRLDLVLSETNTGIWEWDLETDEVIWSETLERMAGLEPGGFGGTFDAFAEFAHPDAVEKVEAALESALETDSRFQVTFRFQPADGGIRWFDARGELLDTDDGGRRMVGILTDVTERKERERRLSNQERQFRQLVERLPQAYYTFDENWTFTFCNDALAERVGKPVDELVGRTLWEELPQLEGTSLAETFREVMKTRESAGCEFHFEEGGYWLDVWAYPHEDGIAVISTDITDQKQKLETVVDFAPVILFRIDEDGVFRESRGRALSKLGLEPGEVVGMSAFDLYGDHPGIIDGLERALEGEAFRETVEIAGVVFELQFRPRLEDGELAEVIGVAMDVTELERRRNQLLTLTEATDALLYAETTETTAVDIVQTGTKLLPEAQAVYWVETEDGGALEPQAMSEGEDVNPGGMDGERIQAGTWEMDAFRCGVFRHIEEYATVENPALSAGRVGSTLLVPLDEHGLLMFVWSESGGFDEGDRSLVEILAETARAGLQSAEREEALESYKNRLEASNERLEQFAYVASHDLQEPLRTVSNFADLLVETVEADLDEEGERYAEVVTTGCARMQSMINGLLDYSRVTTRGEEFTPVDVSELVREVVADLDYVLAEQGGEVEWSDDLPTIQADPVQIRQVFQNLVTNALEHADASVTVEIRGEVGDGVARFEVEDDGPGIEPSRQEKIFRIFKSGTQYQTSGQAKGLGLAICENIVQRHDGDIWVESEPGQGSTFVFTIGTQEQTKAV